MVKPGDPGGAKPQWWRVVQGAIADHPIRSPERDLGYGRGDITRRKRKRKRKRKRERERKA